MKKTVIVLLALVFVAPAMAVDVVFDINDLGSGIVAIEYDATASPNEISAFALKVSVDAGTIEAISNYHIGESNTVGKGYGIFPSNININQTTGVVNSYGNPIAPNTATDAAGTGLDTNSVILELGALYEDGNQPSRTGELCRLTVSGDCNMTITANATRGNVVLDTAEEASTNLSLTESIVTCSNIDLIYGFDRSRCDITDTTLVGPPDGYIGFDDMTLEIYMYGAAPGRSVVDCNTTYSSLAALCQRADITDTTLLGPKDGVIGFDDMTIMIYFYGTAPGQDVCQ